MANSKSVTLHFSAMPFHHYSSHDQQQVSDTALFLCHAITSHLIPWPTACEWHCPFFLPCHLITSHPTINSLLVTLLFFLPFHLITCHLMTNSKWVTPPVFSSSLHSPTCPSGFRVHSKDSEWIPSTFRASQIKSNVPSGFQAHSEPILSSCKVMKGSEHTRNGLGMGSESTQKPSELWVHYEVISLRFECLI